MGVGFPETLLLNEFGSQVWFAFGDMPYHVGSSLAEKSGWRDVDVRLILDDKVYASMGLGDPVNPHLNGKWVALCRAFCLLGKEMTGLPIDFQIQQQSWANNTYQGRRSAIGFIPLRMKE